MFVLINFHDHVLLQLATDTVYTAESSVTSSRSICGYHRCMPWWWNDLCSAIKLLGEIRPPFQVFVEVLGQSYISFTTDEAVIVFWSPGGDLQKTGAPLVICSTFPPAVEVAFLKNPTPHPDTTEFDWVT